MTALNMCPVCKPSSVCGNYSQYLIIATWEQTSKMHYSYVSKTSLNGPRKQKVQVGHS